MTGLTVITDSEGGIHIMAERRHHLFAICDQANLKRRSIRWSNDLRCYALVVRRDQYQEILKINDKGKEVMRWRKNRPRTSSANYSGNR